MEALEHLVELSLVATATMRTEREAGGESVPPTANVGTKRWTYGVEMLGGIS